MKHVYLILIVLAYAAIGVLAQSGGVTTEQKLRVQVVLLQEQLVGLQVQLTRCELKTAESQIQTSNTEVQSNKKALENELRKTLHPKDDEVLDWTTLTFKKKEP